MESKVKELHSKLNSLDIAAFQQPQNSNKTKIRNIQQQLGKLQHRYDQENIMYEHKVTNMFDILRKVQNGLKDSENDLSIQENSWGSRVGKMEKIVKKMMEKLNKERKQADKKIQNTLQSYLIELTSFKGKANSNCLASIRELKQLQKDVDNLEKDVKRDSQLTKDIYKKIYAQFSTQIEEIGTSLAVEERTKQQQEEHILDSIQKTYNTLSYSISESRKYRQKHEKEVVQLLERVIQKIKYQLLND